MILRIVLTVIFVYLVNKNISAEEVVRLIGKLRFTFIVPAFFLGAGSFIFQLLRWRLVLVSHKLPSDFTIVMKTMFRGFFLAFITPGRFGELFRAVDIDTNRNVAPIVAVVEDRFFAVIVTVGAGILCSAAQGLFCRETPFLPLVLASTILTAVFLSLFLLFRSDDNFLLRHPRLNSRLGVIRKYTERIRMLPFPRIALFSAAAHFLLLLQTALLFQMFGSPDFGMNLLVAGQAYAFMLFIPLFIANIGLREYSFALFSERLLQPGFPSAQIGSLALGVATLILIMNIILPAVIGLYWIYIDRKPTKNDM